MLIPQVPSLCSSPEKRGLRPKSLPPSRGIAPSGFSPIAENSPLLPPVGVWAVSQSQCDWSSSPDQLLIVALVGSYPTN